ncbi:MAG: helix-hairpin-helix domain-containing protein [Candidatus Ratteibacteria bacterium]
MKKKLKKQLKLDFKKGDIIILVILILLLIFLFTSTMLILFNFWTKTTGKIIFGREAKNFSKIGIENAIWEIDKDDREYDCFLDLWRKNFEGDEVDLNNDGEKDSKWFYIKDKKGNIIGRYAVLVEDENGKININANGNLNLSFNEGHSCFEINIFEKILEKTLYFNIVNFRYGQDGKPGKIGIDDNKNSLIVLADGIDNNGNGIIDEQNEGIDEDAEFYFIKPYGDDRPYFSPSEIKLVPGFGEKNYEKIKNYITTFSYDRDLNRKEEKRIDINNADFYELVNFFKKMGYPEKQAIQISLNIVDFRDKDSIPTVYKYKSEYMTGIEKVPYLNEIDAVKRWEYRELVIGRVFEEIGGQFIEIFNPYPDQLDIGGWRIEGVFVLFSNHWEEVFNNSKEIYDDFVNKETEIDHDKAGKITKLVDRMTSITIPSGEKIPPHSFYTIGDTIRIVILIPNESPPVILFFPMDGDPDNCKQYERIIALNPGSFGILSGILGQIPFFSNHGLDFTIKLYDNKGNLIEFCEYFADAPETTVQKNDPRMKSMTDWFLGIPSPNKLNYYFQPWIGGEFGVTNWIFAWPSSFYVKNNQFSTLGELGFIHKMEHWKSLNFWKGEDNKIVDYLTCYKKVDENIYGRININTASKEVLECLPLVEQELAEKIISARPFKDVSEVLGIFGDKGEKGKLNQEITKYGFDLKDNDLDLFVDIKKEKEMVFSKIINLITTKSNVFKIISLGQKVQDKNNNGKIEDDEVTGEKKLVVWYDRNKKKIIYKREL